MSNDRTDSQDMAEALDSDKVGTPDDVEVEPDYPADQLLGADDYGTTPAEEQVGEPLSERVDREEPEPLAAELDRATAVPADHLADIELVGADDAGVGADGGTAQGDVAGWSDEPTVGRLVEDQDEDVDRLVDVEAESVARQVDQGDLSAEELAVHVVESPPGEPGADA